MSDAYVAAFSTLPLVTPRRHRALVERGEPRLTWVELTDGSATFASSIVPQSVVDSWVAAARHVDPEALHSSWLRDGIEVLTPCSPLWPSRLAVDPEPPMVLFKRGPGVQSGPTAAIVGTRRCSSYGRRVAHRLGRELAERGITVVSGAAAGIDAEAQRAAFDAGGDVIGVVGSGVDVVYPASNRRLWNDLASCGLLLSEYPPGRRPQPWQFPARNRIIAALADVVVVVESAAAGGSLHTVDSALERDVTVLAVPGPVDSPASVGTNRLLVQGCGPCLDVDDILVALGLSAGSPGPESMPTSGRLALDAVEQVVVDSIGGQSSSIGEIALRTNLPIAELIEALGRLEIRGVVRNTVGWYERAT